MTTRRLHAPPVRTQPAAAPAQLRVAMTREAWLGELVELLRPLFAAVHAELPRHVRVSCGWPSVGGTRSSKRVVGEAWSTRASADGHAEVFVSPVLAKGVDVAGVLVHELVHVAVGHDAGHGPLFARAAKALGLEGKMTSTVVGAKLGALLATMVHQLGAYPHGAMSATERNKPKQGTRMLKVECPACGCIVRMTAKWLGSVGTPTCACGERMLDEDGSTGVSDVDVGEGDGEDWGEGDE